MAVKRRTVSVVDARKGPHLRSLQFSPDLNPLLEPHTVGVRRRQVRAGRGRDLVDPATGEIEAVAAVHTIETVDDSQFVKVFADGVKAAFGLSRTASRVFQVVLDEYQRTPMTGGYAESIYLAWFGNGLSGRDIGMTDRTFQTGLKELLAKGFIAPRSPAMYWVNPGLFFKGDRVAFIREYRRRDASLTPKSLDAEETADAQQKLPL